MINKRLIYAKPSFVVTAKSACNDFQANSKPLGASTDHGLHSGEHSLTTAHGAR